jgi:DNA-binding CsgD family transcriptional regulator
MTAGMADRPAEEETLGEFLDAASSAPSALLVDGEAGIGKTTLWRAGLERACDRGFQAPAPNSPHRPRAQARDGLTPAEQRVAELAASGMTNRDVAARLFISSKTVEATLARVYRKLGIRSRAELGRHVDTIRQ